MSKNEVADSVSIALSSTVRHKATIKAAEDGLEETKKQLGAKLNILLDPIKREHNRKEKNRAPEKLPNPHFDEERSDKGLRELKDLRVLSIEIDNQKIDIEVEAVLVEKISTVMGQNHVLPPLRTELYPQIKTALESADSRLKFKYLKIAGEFDHSWDF